MWLSEKISIIFGGACGLAVSLMNNTLGYIPLRNYPHRHLAWVFCGSIFGEFMWIYRIKIQDHEETWFRLRKTLIRQLNEDAQERERLMQEQQTATVK